MRQYCGRGARRTSRFLWGAGRIEFLEPRIALSGSPTVVDVEVSSTDWTPAFVTYLNGQGLGEQGYRIPVGSSAQTAALPWNNLDQILISFSEDVHVQAADLSLSGVNTTSYGIADFFYDPQTLTATWTLDAPIVNDRLQIDLDANGIDPVRDLDGNVLDGEWTNNVSTFGSGNGQAGGDFQFLINVLRGDVNNSGQVTYLDYVSVRGRDGSDTQSEGYTPFYDINGSGVINSADWQAVLANWGQMLPTGSPAGSSNDAPTAVRINTESVSDDAIDVAISLLSSFADAEDGASGLTYSIKSNSNPSLFDTVSIDSQTKSLVVNAASGASGRADVTIAATDAGGLTTATTLTVDVDYVNQPPSISQYVAEEQPNDMWLISGRVTDPDDDTTGWIVDFYGVFDTRAAVYPDGRFEFTILLEPSANGEEIAVTWDPHGLQSDLVTTDIGLV